jgi:D-alanine-D-alanine ligase
VKDESIAHIIRIPSSRFKRNVLGSIDVAFPVMHGTGGEDGTLQGYFEMIGIPYVGCNVLASSVGMDKVFTKSILRKEGLPVLDHLWFYSEEIQAQTEKVVATIETKFKYPVIVKPANLGSSIGITTALNRSELEEALDLALTFSLKIMIEPKIVNIKEVNCSVLGDYTHCDASVCEEPVKTEEILSFKDKYMSGNKSKGMSSLKRRIPADISQEMTEKIRSLAKNTFRAMGCSGVARIDFIIETSTNAFYINEINTIPGSLSFYLWEPAGLDFISLTSKLIDLAFKREREYNKLVFSWDTNLLSMSGKSGSKAKLSTK